MKKIVILSCLGFSLFAASDYIPLSELSDDEKVGYNFANKKDKDIVKPIESTNYTSVSKKTNEVIQPIEDNKIEEKIENIDEVKKNEISSNENKNEDILNELKKENILKDVTKENKIEKMVNRDFSISPKLTYTYLKTDIYGTQRVSVVDERSVLLPEIALRYKNHTIKADFMESKAYFNNVLLIGSDLETDTTWYKFHYLYGYKNANLGLAYNKFDLDWKAVQYDFILPLNEEFPSLEINFKNEENNLQALYGASYGKNNNIEYAYEYYLSLGYKILNNDSLILSAGYKNKTIEFENENFNGYRFQYKGPTLGLSSSF